MNAKKVLLAMLLTVTTVSGALAQKFDTSPSFLKGEKQVNLVFDYSQVKFGGVSKDTYYKSKDESWIKEWEGKRKESNESTFTDYFNKGLQPANIDAGAYPKAQYTIIINVLDCDFGKFAGPMSKLAKVKCTMQIVKTGSTNALSSITTQRTQNAFGAVGTAVDFDRIYLAFSKTGEDLGINLAKALK